VKKWLYAAAAILIAIGFSILGRDARAAKKAGDQRDQLLLEGSGRAKRKAHLAGIKADMLQKDAENAAKFGQAAVDKVGSNDETMRDILDRWNADRVQ